MDRVLDTERAAQTVIGECETQAARTVEQAREDRQRILERAQSRIVSLHTRAAGALENRARSMAGKSSQSANSAGDHLADYARRMKALHRLAEYLTTDPCEQSPDVR
jgi:hypothetical protein